jgi:hypothetical protein
MHIEKFWCDLLRYLSHCFTICLSMKEVVFGKVYGVSNSQPRGVRCSL